MANAVISRAGRAGEDESSVAALLIRHMTDAVPNLWDDLPLIDQPWFWTLQELPRQQPSLCPRLLILLKRGLATSMISPGPRLAACLCPLDYHYRGALQGFSDLLVRDPLDIASRG